jgi:hypothetical protein
LSTHHLIASYLVVIDVSDPTAPTEMSRTSLNGRIVSGVVVGGDRVKSLYVVSYPNSNTGIYDIFWIDSFLIADDGTLLHRDHVDTTDEFSDMSATPETLVVHHHRFRYDEWYEPCDDNYFALQLVDISAGDGTMAVAADVVEPAMKYFPGANDLVYSGIFNNILRVHTGSGIVKAYDVSDVYNPVEIDSVEIHIGTTYSRVNLENRVYTSVLSDSDSSLLMLELDDGGRVSQQVSIPTSTTDFKLASVFGDTRLIGIGYTIRIYDVTGDAPVILAEENMEWDNIDGKLGWPHTPASVHENAISAVAPDGTEETGLLVVPFWEYGADWGGIQLFTFSSSTVTSRGLVNSSNGYTRITARLKNGVVVGANDMGINLYNIDDLQEPPTLHRMRFGPGTDTFQVFDETVMFHYSNRTCYESEPLEPPDHLENLYYNGERLETIPSMIFGSCAGSHFIKVGEHHAVSYRNKIGNWMDDLDEFVILEVFDLTTPSSPRLVADMFSDAPGDLPRVADELLATDRAVLFVEWGSQTLRPDGEMPCFYATKHDSHFACYDDSFEPIVGCSFDTGSLFCSGKNEMEQQCNGEIKRCTFTIDGGRECVAIDANREQLEAYCYPPDQKRQWRTMAFTVMDLSDPAEPRFVERISMPVEYEIENIFVQDNTFYISYKVPSVRAGDDRPYVRYYYRAVNLENPASPLVSDPVNLPGKLVAIEDDLLITSDIVYEDETVQTVVNRLTQDRGRAYVDGAVGFDNHTLVDVRRFETGAVLVTHKETINIRYNSTHRFSILGPGDSLPMESTTLLNAEATLAAGTANRAVFLRPDGVAVFDISTPTKPEALLFTPMPIDLRTVQTTVADDTFYLASGSLGMYRFQLGD